MLTQLPCSAAQAGTATGLGKALGEGEGLAVGLSSGLGLGLGDGVVRFAEGLVRGVSGPFAVQPAIAARHKRSTTPFLTTG